MRNIIAMLYSCRGTSTRNSLVFGIFHISAGWSSCTQSSENNCCIKQKHLIPPTLWPPKSPDLNLVDYKIWSVMRGKCTDIGSMMSTSCEIEFWRLGIEMDPHVIDEAVKQWRERLRACVNANGGHFEHFLYLSMLNYNFWFLILNCFIWLNPLIVHKDKINI